MRFLSDWRRAYPCGVRLPRRLNVPRGSSGHIAGPQGTSGSMLCAPPRLSSRFPGRNAGSPARLASREGAPTTRTIEARQARTFSPAVSAVPRAEASKHVAAQGKRLASHCRRIEKGSQCKKRQRPESMWSGHSKISAAPRCGYCKLKGEKFAPPEVPLTRPEQTAQKSPLAGAVRAGLDGPDVSSHQKRPKGKTTVPR